MIIKEQINKFAQLQTKKLISDLSIELNSLLKECNLTNDVEILGEVTGIPSEDLYDIINNTDDIDNCPYSLNLYNKVHKLCYQIPRLRLIRAIKSYKNKKVQKPKIEIDNNNHVKNKANGVYLGKCVWDPYNGWDNSQCKVKWNIVPDKRTITTKAQPLGDEVFLDNINKELKDMGCKEQIDTKEALEAKKCFEEDIKPEPKSNFQKKILKDYDKCVKRAQMELFGNTDLLDNQTIPTLLSYIDKNGWGKEFDPELRGHRQSVLIFLYNKLQEKTGEIMKSVNNITTEQMNDYNKLKNKATKKFNEMKEKKEDYHTEGFNLIKDVFGAIFPGIQFS